MVGMQAWGAVESGVVGGALASMLGLKSSEYIRQAVQEKNEQVMAQRMAMLSKALSADHLSLNESLGDSLEDGLH